MMVNRIYVSLEENVNNVYSTYTLKLMYSTCTEFLLANGNIAQNHGCISIEIQTLDTAVKDRQ